MNGVDNRTRVVQADSRTNSERASTPTGVHQPGAGSVELHLFG